MYLLMEDCNEMQGLLRQFYQDKQFVKWVKWVKWVKDVLF